MLSVWLFFIIIAVITRFLSGRHMNWLYMTCSPCTAKNVAKNVFP
jgi:glycine cleavage system regulatory protein